MKKIQDQYIADDTAGNENEDNKKQNQKIKGRQKTKSEDKTKIRK